MSQLNFKLLFNGGLITNQTTIKNKKGERTTIKDAATLAGFMYSVWKKETQSKSFEDWANELNESGEYEGTFTADDAKDNFNSFFQLNIDNKHVNTLEFFETHYPKTIEAFDQKKKLETMLTLAKMANAASMLAEFMVEAGIENIEDVLPMFTETVKRKLKVRDSGIYRGIDTVQLWKDGAMMTANLSILDAEAGLNSGRYSLISGQAVSVA